MMALRFKDNGMGAIGKIAINTEVDSAAAVEAAVRDGDYSRLTPAIAELVMKQMRKMIADGRAQGSGKSFTRDDFLKDIKRRVAALG
jgi:hypothetical protein